MKGFGLGLRSKHYPEYEICIPREIDWFEALTENYMAEGGYALHMLEQVRRERPVVLHGVCLSIGSVDELNLKYLEDLKKLVQRIEPEWVSDHLCWTTRKGHHSLDLLPVPYTNETLRLIGDRLDYVQNFIGKPLLMENVSSYIEFQDSEMTEWEFLNALTKSSGCKLLLDVNNIFVSSFNHGFEARTFIDAIASESVGQMHLAGHTHYGNHIVDTHDENICHEVWQLYEYTCRRFGVAIPTMIERDDNIPALKDLLVELSMARSLQTAALTMNAERRGTYESRADSKVILDISHHAHS